MNPKSLSERERGREREREKKKKKREGEDEEEDQVTWDKIDLQKSGSDHPPDDLKLLIFVLVLCCNGVLIWVLVFFVQIGLQ
jgi:hypothetical protein